MLSILPKYPVSEVVGFLKGKSAIQIFEKYDDLRKRYWGRHFWAGGYCVSTVGVDEKQIRAYVRYQEKVEKAEEAQGVLWEQWFLLGNSKATLSGGGNLPSM